jgi:hypothetical protein
MSGIQSVRLSRLLLRRRTDGLSGTLDKYERLMTRQVLALLRECLSSLLRRRTTMTEQIKNDPIKSMRQENENTNLFNGVAILLDEDTDNMVVYHEKCDTDILLLETDNEFGEVLDKVLEHLGECYVEEDDEDEEFDFYDEDDEEE